MKHVTLFLILMGIFVACEDRSKQYKIQLQKERRQTELATQRANDYKQWLYFSVFGAFSLYLVGVGIGSYTKRLSRKDE